MMTGDSSVVSYSNINLTVKLKHLVKLRSFKNQPNDMNILRLEDSSSSDQLWAAESSTDNISKQEKALNEGLNSANCHQELIWKSVPGSVKHFSESQLVLNNHVKDNYTVHATRVSESIISHTENNETFSIARLPDSKSTQTLRDLSGTLQSSISRQNIVNDSNGENNFQAINTNIPKPTVKSRDSQFIKTDETGEEVLKTRSQMQTKQITSAVPLRGVTEACRAITRNFETSAIVSETKFAIQGCNESSNSVDKYTGDSMRIASRKMHQKEYSGSAENTDTVGRINSGLQMLKSELEEMRETDLALLKQLIVISQAIQRMQRTNLMRFSRSLSLVSSSRNLHLHYRTIERQISAPHSASCRRDSFSFRRSSTEDSLEDSLYSLEARDSESQNQHGESNSSLSIFYTSSTTRPSKLYHDLILSYDLSENTEEEYEDILRRNVRLWKIGSQRQDLLEEMLVV